ncbi:hypothetical protein M758_UG207200 [Ceratodon purpureus]|nr:hypothetical protein M758_UG207200 [Ceratodon purpureus]
MSQLPAPLSQRSTPLLFLPAPASSSIKMSDAEESQIHLPPNMRTNEDGLPIANFGDHYWFPQRREDREDISQAFECRHGDCTRKFKNLKNLRGHMKKKHHLFIEKDKPRRPRTNHRHRIQDHKRMNSKIMGNVEKRLRKIHGQQVEVWRKKALASWNDIEETAEDSEPLPKPLLCRFLDSKKQDILGISEWGIGLIDSEKWTTLDTNDVFLRKIATTRASKYASLVKAFSKNHIPHERKVFKEELLAYHKDQEVFYWYNLGWEKYEQEMLNVEESLWNMKSTSIRSKVEEKVEDYRARYPRYFHE